MPEAKILDETGRYSELGVACQTVFQSLQDSENSWQQCSAGVQDSSCSFSVTLCVCFDLLLPHYWDTMRYNEISCKCEKRITWALLVDVT